MPFDSQLVEAQLSLGRIHPEDMPSLAADALEAGLDGPCIRRLAASIKPSGWETDQLQPGFMKECGLSAMPLDKAATRIASDLATRILDQHLDPLDFQKEFYHLWLEGGYVRELQEIGNLEDMTAIGASDEDVRKFALRELEDLGNDSRTKPSAPISDRK